METYIPYSMLSINISHEEVQNIAHMKEDEAFEHLRTFYAIDTGRIISCSILKEDTIRPTMLLKITV